LDPTKWDPWNNKAAALFNLKRNEEAIPCCDEAIRLDPAKWDPWNVKAAVLFELERYEECIACGNETIRLDPARLELWHDKALALLELKCYEECSDFVDEGILIFEKNILDVTDSFTLLMRNQTICILKSMKAAVLSELKQYDESIVYLNHSIELHPKSYALWWVKGEVLKEMGKEKEAELCSTKAKKLEEEFAYEIETIAKKESN
jgi:tetratricopeptide (TPR) repeat protein